jgi:cell division septum initiation protein DivIVA
MRYTPVELRHVRLGRALIGGYKRSEADLVLADVADSFEDVWRERGDLADRLEEAERRLEDFKQRETLLASTLVAAERTAAEAIEAAKREAEIIVAEAHHEARSITRSAQSERERLFAEARRVGTLLRSALGLVEESQHAPSPGGEQADGEAASWPNRENTTEFEAVSLENVAEAEAEAEAQAKAAAPPEAAVADPEHANDDDPQLPWSSGGRDFAWG